MNRKQLLLISLAGASLLAFTASQMVWSKAHVPIGLGQVCHKGKARVIDLHKIRKHLKHGDCQLPACDQANIFRAGDSCLGDSTGDGFCDVANMRDDKHLETLACTLPF